MRFQSFVFPLMPGGVVSLACRPLLCRHEELLVDGFSPFGLHRLHPDVDSQLLPSRSTSRLANLRERSWRHPLLTRVADQSGQCERAQVAWTYRTGAMETPTQLSRKAAFEATPV